MKTINWDLKKVAIVLLIGFGAMVFFGAYITPTKEFIATTSPTEFPFQLSEVNSISVTSLPDDHVVLCYFDGDSINYRESYTRGFTWYEPIELIDGNISSANNLYAKTINGGEDYTLLLTWDALVDPGNQSSRKAFYAVVNLTTNQLIVAPTLCSNDSLDAYESYPVLEGDYQVGFYLGWITNVSGDHELHLKYSTNLVDWGAPILISHGNNNLSDPVVLKTTEDEFKVLYKKDNETVSQVLIRDLFLNGTFESASVLMNFSSVNRTVKYRDYSLTSNKDIVISYKIVDTLSNTTFSNASFIYWGKINDSKENKIETIQNDKNIYQLQHVIFSNDQVLTLWMNDGANSNIYFIITDFDMNNRNSIYHSVLLAYIYIACGIFNIFVIIHLRSKKSKEEQEESEPMNNVFVTLIFFAIGSLMLIPNSGFQGESMGSSYADGYIIPAPINLGALIVIGFVFLFYLVMTPLLTRYWPDKWKKAEDFSYLSKADVSYSLKQEFLRKIPHLAVALLIIGFHPIGSNAMSFVDIAKYDRYNFVNEGAIVFDYVLRLNPIEIGSYAVKLVMISGIVFLWLLDLHVLLAPKKEFAMKQFLVYVFRKKEKNSMADFIVMFLSLMLALLILTFNPAYKLQGHFTTLAIFSSLCIGDTAGALFGKRFGRHNLSPRAKKTWEGTFAGTIASLLLSLIFVSWPFAFIIAGVYFLVDLITPKIPISDNILIPLISAIALVFFLPFISSPLSGFF